MNILMTLIVLIVSHLPLSQNTPKVIHPVKHTPVRTVSQPASRSGIRHNWWRVAQCESSGNWRADTGNGFFGGLQFTLQTWRAYGGVGLPQNNSSFSQIAVAERVLKGQGIGAWPVCGRYLTAG